MTAARWSAWLLWGAFANIIAGVAFVLLRACSVLASQPGLNCRRVNDVLAICRNSPGFEHEFGRMRS